jgi:aerobic-type carbon monoxide dehydrogenase small subunit (CoxS/CutS family)
VSIRFELNGQDREVDLAGDTPLLWVLRDHLDMTGTKFGCGISLCGACTVHLDGEAVRACTTTLSEVSGRSVTTIEGLAEAETLHPVQEAWLAEEVSQCGFCQPGQIMTAAALLARNPDPSDEEIEAALEDHLCRCGTYNRAKRAVRRAAQAVRSE